MTKFTIYGIEITFKGGKLSGYDEENERRWSIGDVHKVFLRAGTLFVVISGQSDAILADVDPCRGTQTHLGRFNQVPKFARMSGDQRYVALFTDSVVDLIDLEDNPKTREVQRYVFSNLDAETTDVTLDGHMIRVERSDGSVVRIRYSDDCATGDWDGRECACTEGEMDHREEHPLAYFGQHVFHDGLDLEFHDEFNKNAAELFEEHAKQARDKVRVCRNIYNAALLKAGNFSLTGKRNGGEQEGRPTKRHRHIV